MSLSTEGFTLLGTLKVPSLEVPSLGAGVTSSNTPLLIKAADLTTAMKTSLKADWGDLRLSTDSAGNTQLPLDIAATDYAWTRLTSVAVDELIHVWGNKPAAVKEINTATYGRDAVWSTSKRVYHFEENPATADMVDSSGNTDGARVGTFAAGDKVTGTNGSALKFTLNTNYLNAGNVSPVSNQLKTVSMITEFQTLTSLRGLWSVANSYIAGDPSLLMAMRSSSVDMLDTGGYQDAFTPVAGTVYKIDYVYDGTTTTIYVDGSLATSYASDDGVYQTGQTLYVNSGFANSADQLISEFEYAEYAKTPDQISIEYQNQTASGAWWIADDVGGGGTITVSPTLGTISYSGNATTIGLFGSVDVTATLGTISYTGNNTTVGLFGVVDVTAGLGTISYTSNNTAIQVSGAIEVNPTLGAISYTSNATTVQVTGSVDVTATLGAISYTSNNTVVDLGGAITVAAGLGTINYVSNDTIVGLTGQIGINATLGTISYTSNNTIVIASNGQSIGEINTSFAGDLYGSNFKPNSITVTFRG